MFTFTLLYKYKPGVDANELNRLYNELADPIIRKTPGLISVNNYKILKESDAPDYDYSYVELWENKEIYFKEVYNSSNQIAETGFMDKFSSAVEKAFSFRAESTE